MVTGEVNNRANPVTSPTCNEMIDWIQGRTHGWEERESEEREREDKRGRGRGGMEKGRGKEKKREGEKERDKGTEGAGE